MKNEIGVAHRLKRRWMMGLGFVGALALLSLVLVGVVAARKQEAAPPSSSKAVTMKRTQNESPWNWFNWAGNGTEESNVADGAEKINFTLAEIGRFKREGVLERQLLDTANKMQQLEDRVQSLELLLETASNGAKEKADSGETVAISAMVQRQINDLIKNLTNSNAASTQRLNGMQEQMASMKSELATTQQQITVVEQNATKRYPSSESRSASSMFEEISLSELRTNFSYCQLSVEDLKQKVSVNSLALDQFLSNSTELAKKADLDEAVVRISNQERKSESAYSELNSQLSESRKSRQELEATQNADISGIKEDLNRLRVSVTALDGSLQKVSSSKGKCLVGRVSPPNCPSGDTACWPYQKNVIFSTAFDSTPTVVAALSKLDTNTDESRGLMNGNKDNVVVSVIAGSAKTSSFNLRIDGGKHSTDGGNNHLFDADVVWIACA